MSENKPGGGIEITPGEDGWALASAQVSRRTLMSALAKIGLLSATAAAAGGIVGYRQEETAYGDTTEKKHAWCMVIDLRRCDGCGACVSGCQTRHELPKEQTWIKVYTLKDAAGGSYHMPRPCMMCENPPCVKVCPVGANSVDAGGLTLVDQNVCIGSRACMAACPYDARYFNWNEPPKPKAAMPMAPTPQMPVPQQKGTVGKCVFCADRLPQGELPACVSVCPMAALYIGDLISDVGINSRGETIKLSQYLRDNDAVRFKEEEGTSPRVYYILGHGQNLETDA